MFLIEVFMKILDKVLKILKRPSDTDYQILIDRLDQVLNTEEKLKNHLRITGIVYRINFIKRRLRDKEFKVDLSFYKNNFEIYHDIIVNKKVKTVDGYIDVEKLDD